MDFLERPFVEVRQALTHNTKNNIKRIIKGRIKGMYSMPWLNEVCISEYLYMTHHNKKKGEIVDVLYTTGCVLFLTPCTILQIMFIIIPKRNWTAYATQSRAADETNDHNATK